MEVGPGLTRNLFLFAKSSHMLPVNLQKLLVRVDPIRMTRHVNMFERGYIRTECLYQIVGLNYGMVLKANLKVVVMYRYSRNVLKKSVCILMI